MAAAVLLYSGALILVIAALHDLAFRTIPNWMVVILFLVGSLASVLSGTFVPALLISLLVLLGAAFCWRRGWLGGGDVKLLAVCAMLVPPTLAVRLLLDVALAGGVLALVYLALARMTKFPVAPQPRGLLRRISRIERYRIRRRGSLPYASAIAAGALFVMLTT